MGYRISKEGIQPDEDKVQKIMEMRKPTNVKELRSALGMWTYFSSFIPRYSIIAAPLMAQLRRDNKTLTWSPECEEAWNMIKKNLASAPVMGYPDYTQPFYLHTDACKSGFAAVLTQMQKGKRVMIDATSRTTDQAEKNYSSAKLECACVIWAAKKWKHYLYSAKHTTIVTDSYGLQYLQQKGSRSALVERWICEMEGFDYSVMYRRGAENIADYLSRQNDVVTATPAQTRSDKEEIRRDFLALSKGEWKTKPKERKKADHHDDKSEWHKRKGKEASTCSKMRQTLQ